jgi:hypothetical protein
MLSSNPCIIPHTLIFHFAPVHKLIFLVTPAHARARAHTHTHITNLGKSTHLGLYYVFMQVHTLTLSPYESQQNNTNSLYRPTKTHMLISSSCKYTHPYKFSKSTHSLPLHVNLHILHLHVNPSVIVLAATTTELVLLT